jgi:large repetitive protein
MLPGQLKLGLPANRPQHIGDSYLQIATMARRSSRTMASVFAQFLKTIFRAPRKNRHKPRGFAFEPLETRALLASDFGAISGLIYRDATGNGFTAGEEVAGATVNLYSDDGDGVFEPAGDDAPATADVTDASGRYRFDGLSAGSYWIEQPAQTVGSLILSSQNSALITVSALEAQGIVPATIDDYTETGPLVNAGPPVGTKDFDVATAASALGDERDLLVEFTSGGDGETVELEAIAGALSFDASLTAQGRYVSVWDGIDGDGETINFAGLSNHDLTSGGAATAIRLFAGVDQAGATARIRVFTDADNWSEQTIPIPNAVSNELIFRFSSFAQGGAASGPANFASVNAIELQIDTSVNATDGQVTVVETLGPTVKTQDFTNPADLSLTKEVNIANPDVGQNVIFTITVTNAGPGAANNVVVTDTLPAGLQFVSATPSQGTFEVISGTWSVGSIDAGDNATLQIEATATSGTSQNNDAEVTDVDEFDPDSTPDNNTAGEDDQDSANVNAVLVDLSVEKSVNNPTPGDNEVVTFTIIVSNASDDEATGVVVNDDLPAGLVFVSSTAGADYNPATGEWNVGVVPASGQRSMQIQARVTTADVKINTAELIALDQDDADSTPNNNNPQEDDQDSVTLTPLIADVAVTKTADNLTPDRNDVITFTIEATNDGPDAATSIVVTDLLPGGLTLGNVNAPAGTSYNQTNGQWTIDSLASGVKATLTLTATATTSGAKINTATLTSLNQFDTNTENDSQSVTVTPEVANLAVTKTVDNATPDKNDLLEFGIVVTNSGPDAATNVVVADLLPTGLTLGTAIAEAGTNYNSTTGAWTIPSLANGATATLTLTATAASSGLKTNTAQVTASDQFDTNTADNQAGVDVTPQVADLSVVKEVNDSTPNAGQSITFTIRVINSSTTQQATGVTLTDQIPAGMTIGTATPSSGTYNQTTGVWDIGTIAANATATLTITATSTTAAQKTNTARLTTADQFDPDSTPGNTAAGEDDEMTITITPNVADVRLSKTVSTSSPQVGQQVTFKVTVTNDGPQAATGVKVTDQLPAGLSFVSKNVPAGTTYNETTGIWDIPTLASGSSLELTIVATATQTGALANKAEVTALNEFDSDSTPNNNVATEDDQDTETVNATQLISPRLCTIVWHRG